MIIANCETLASPYAWADHRASAAPSSGSATSLARRRRPAAQLAVSPAASALATVCVVDRDAATRQHVADLVQTMDYACETFTAFGEFLRQYEAARPGCVVMELSLPGINWLRSRQPLDTADGHLPVVFLTSLAEVSLAVQAMRCGAANFLEKPFRVHDLWNAIQEAIELDARQREVDRWWQEQCERTRQLSSKEQRLLRLIGQGKSNQEIAKKLQVCVRTVELNRAALLKKLKLDSLRDAIELGMVLNWAEGQAPAEAVFGSERS